MSHGYSARWPFEGSAGVLFCTNSGRLLEVFTFPTDFDENQWLARDSGSVLQIEPPPKPNPVFIGNGWIALLGWNTSNSGITEGQLVTSISRCLGTSYYFRTFQIAS